MRCSVSSRAARNMRRACDHNVWCPNRTIRRDMHRCGRMIQPDEEDDTTAPKPRPGASDYIKDFASKAKERWIG
jgi:hypothetical protein